MEKGNKKTDKKNKHPQLLSMTGFAYLEKPVDHDFGVRLELKSLNHRYSDIKVRLPRELSHFEIEIRQKVQAHLPRGSIELRLEFTQNNSSVDVDYEINKPYLEKLISEIKEIGRNTGSSQNYQVESLLSLPGVLSKKIPHVLKNKDKDSFFSFFDPLFLELLFDLNKMRKQEGSSLFKVLNESLNQLFHITQDAKNKRTLSKEKWKEKITQKISAIFDAYPMDHASTQMLLESKISQELAYLLEKTDIEEELKRLETHCEALLQLLKQGSPLGRKFEFLTQELHREMNTLGNKAQDTEISECALQGKILIDQLKEQAMNIE